MMATNSNVPAAEPGVFGPRRRGTAHGRSPRLVDAGSVHLKIVSKHSHESHKFYELSLASLMWP